MLGANAVYFALSASGLVALHALSAEAFTWLRWGGAAYLVWLGVATIARSFRATDAAAAGVAPAPGRPFVRGFVTQGANPNLLVYFTAILPQFVDASGSVAAQVAVLAFSSFVIELGVLSAYAALSGRARAAAPGFQAHLERIGGGLLIAAAAGLARVERE